MNFRKIIPYFFLITVSCIDPYVPPVIVSKGILVVNGHIYIEEKACKIQLARSQAITSKEAAVPELGAIISAEDIDGNLYTLAELGNGAYATFSNDFNYDVKYKLNIKTADGKKYESTFVSALKSPAIDTIYFEKGTTQEASEFSNALLQNWLVTLNANDPETRNKYYRFEFTETWEYRAYFISKYEYRPPNPLIIAPSIRNQLIYNCWKTDSTKTILTYSTENLNQNLISKFKLNSIPISSKKLDHSYSVESKIYAISKDEYTYWENLKKNSQSTGSVFDPQPSQITGNMKSLSDKEDLILGYFSPYSVSKFRRTIVSTDLNPVSFNKDNSDCKDGLNTIKPEEIANPSREGKLFIEKLYNQTGVFIGYSVTDARCADCRLVSPFGSIFKPPYMP